MEAVRVDRARVLALESRALRDPLKRQIHRRVILVDGIAHRLRLVAIRPATHKRRPTLLITVTTDRTRACAHVHVARERLESPEFVASLLAHAIRAVLTGELPSDAIEAL